MSRRSSRTIYVGNLPGDIRMREVEDLFLKTCWKDHWVLGVEHLRINVYDVYFPSFRLRSWTRSRSPNSSPRPRTLSRLRSRSRSLSRSLSPYAR